MKRNKSINECSNCGDTEDTDMRESDKTGKLICESCITKEMIEENSIYE